MSVAEIGPDASRRDGGRGNVPVEFERTPPQDLAAEQSVLGGMMLSKDAIADVVEVLRSADFYRPAHALIYDAVLDLYSRGEPADPITVSAELTKRGEIGRVGGAPYLHTCMSLVPTAANAGYYAQIVAEQAVLRRLVTAGTRIVQLGYSGAEAGGDVDDIVDRAQAEVYDVTERRTSEDYVSLEHVLQGTLDEIESIGSRGGAMAGVPTGFAELDQLTNGLHGGQMIVIAARPAMGKSTFGLDIARSASIKHGLASVIFSLEMGRNEITMRLLSAEADVPLKRMRDGAMSDDDWARLARRMGEVAEAPLFIDDSPNLTMMEIRAKARRLRQRHDLRLVIIDYLQLMTSGKRVESRQQEVSEFSRSMKLLAKELDVPVIAISQLNRGPEQRTDKRPMLADLRESGCMTESTVLLRADNGQPITFRQLIDDGYDGVLVWSFDDQRRLVPAPITNVFSSGVKPVFRLHLASGREVEATANHPFLSLEGWTRLERLRLGDRIAIPRRVPEPLAPGLGWSEQRLGLLAHLIGDGCVLSRQPVHYTSQDPENLHFVEQAAIAEFGIAPRRVKQASWWHSYLPAPQHCTHGKRNPIMEWFAELGIGSLRSFEKRIPDAIFSASRDETACFLRHLWATDGNVTPGTPSRPFPRKVYYATSSRELADGVALLLGRFGIVARIRTARKPGYRPGYHVVVADTPSLLTFCREVGVHGRRGELVVALAARLDGNRANTNVDTLPIEVWKQVRRSRSQLGLSERSFQAAIHTRYCGSALYKSAPSRERLSRCADALKSDLLEQLATDDVFWDRVIAIEPLGDQPVYDATVNGTHNFIANGIAAHNSIEQDADMVVLIHREDFYERESPRQGEADLIVAKNRNGPTERVTVAFQGHYSRFTDFSPGL